MESHTICHFVTGLLFLVWCLQGSSTLQHVSEHHSFVKIRRLEGRWDEVVWACLPWLAVGERRAGGPFKKFQVSPGCFLATSQGQQVVWLMGQQKNKQLPTPNLSPKSSKLPKIQGLGDWLDLAARQSGELRWGEGLLIIHTLMWISIFRSFSSIPSSAEQEGIGVESRVRQKFWSIRMAALFTQHLSPGHLGRRRERRGTWNWEEKAEELTLLLPVLTRTRWDTSLTHPAHLESWNGERWVLQLPPFPPFLLCRFSGDRDMEVSKADSWSSNAKLFFVETVNVLFSHIRTSTSSSKFLWPLALKRRRFTYFDALIEAGGLLSPNCCSFLAFKPWIGWWKCSQHWLKYTWSGETGKRFLGLCCWPDSVLCLQCCWPNSALCFHWMSWLFLYHFLVSELPSLLSNFPCPNFQ